MEHTFGFKRMRIAALDDEGLVIPSKSHVLEGDGKGGTVSAKIGGLESPTAVISASDGAYYTSASGVSEVTLEVEVVELTQQQKADVLGHVYEDGIIKAGKQSRPPYVAVVLESEDKNGKGVYISLLKGKMTSDSVELATGEADKAKEGQLTTLSGSFETKGEEGWAYMATRESDPSFDLDAFLALVMPTGSTQTPDPVEPTE